MRVDKTLSELWVLVDHHEDKEVREIAKMAINAICKMDEEHDKFVNTSYDVLKKEEEKVRQYEEALIVIQGLSTFVMLSEAPEQIRKIEKYTTEILNS